MPGCNLPRIPPVNLEQSWRAAEALSAAAERSRDPGLQRSLLQASCRVLDRALDLSEPSLAARGRRPS